MTKIAILSVPTQKGGVTFRAVTGATQSQGKTAGEALDALTAQLPAEDAGMMVVVQNFRPDKFFSQKQQQRLATIMARWQDNQAQGRDLPDGERQELETLIDAELRGAAARAAELADELGR